MRQVAFLWAVALAACAFGCSKPHPAPHFPSGIVLGSRTRHGVKTLQRAKGRPGARGVDALRVPHR